MIAAAVPVEECNLLFVQSGGQAFAVDPVDVVRIDRPNPSLPTAAVFPGHASRMLVARGPGGEFQVAVDRVVGVRRFPRTALRPPPQLARLLTGPRADEVMGVVLDGELPVLIVDLQALSARAERPASQQGT